MKKPKHCNGCLSLAEHPNKKNLTDEQKRHDNWCCAQGKPAAKSIGFCITHNLKRIK